MQIKTISELVYPVGISPGAEAQDFCHLNAALKGRSSTDRDTATLRFAFRTVPKNIRTEKNLATRCENKYLTLRRIILLIVAVVLAVGVYAGLQHFTRRKAEIAGDRLAGSGATSSSAKLPAAFPNLPAAPELSFIDINGATVRTADYKGRVVLVNFWAAWCVPCAEEVPQFVALQKKYQGEGLQVIGISVEDDAGKLRDFCREHQINYPIVPSDLRIADAFGGVLGLPTTFVIGRDSR